MWCWKRTTNSSSEGILCSFLKSAGFDPHGKQENGDLNNQLGEVLHGVGVGMAHPDRCLGQESALRLFSCNTIHSCLRRKEQQEVGLSCKEELG